MTDLPPTLQTDLRDGVLVVTLDVPGEAVNVLGRRVREDVATLLERLERDQSVTGVVLASGKPDVWIAGADVEELLTIDNPGEAERLSRDGQKLLARLEALRVPIVAAIHDHPLSSS